MASGESWNPIFFLAKYRPLFAVQMPSGFDLDNLQRRSLLLVAWFPKIVQIKTIPFTSTLMLKVRETIFQSNKLIPQRP